MNLETLRLMVKLENQIFELRQQATHLLVNCNISGQQEAYLRSLLFVLYADSVTHLKDSVTVHKSGDGQIWSLNNLLQGTRFHETRT